jgi:ribosomal protein L12E/L44/L45/RPP1/RPP2
LTQGKELKIEEKLKDIKDKAEAHVEKGIREVALSEMSLNDMEEKIKETNGQLAGTASRLADVLCAVVHKEREIHQTVEQTQEKVSEYKRR